MILRMIQTEDVAIVLRHICGNQATELFSVEPSAVACHWIARHMVGCMLVSFKRFRSRSEAAEYIYWMMM